MMVSQCTSSLYHFKMLYKGGKKRTYYILQNTLLTICMFICICKCICMYLCRYVCMCRGINIGNISYLCLNWRWQRNFPEHQPIEWDYNNDPNYFPQLSSQWLRSAHWMESLQRYTVRYFSLWKNSIPSFSGITFNYVMRQFKGIDKTMKQYFLLKKKRKQFIPFPFNWIKKTMK